MNRTPRNANVFPPVDDAIAGARTLPEMFRARVALTPDAVAYRQHDPRSGAGSTGRGARRARKSSAGARRSRASDLPQARASRR